MWWSLFVFFSGLVVGAGGATAAIIWAVFFYNTRSRNFDMTATNDAETHQWDYPGQSPAERKAARLATYHRLLTERGAAVDHPTLRQRARTEGVRAGTTTIIAAPIDAAARRPTLTTPEPNGFVIVENGEGVIKEGHINMIGGRFSTWKKRWCKLRRAPPMRGGDGRGRGQLHFSYELQVYVKREDVEPVKTFPICEITVKDVSDDRRLAFYMSSSFFSPSEQMVFEIKREKDQWMEAILSANTTIHQTMADTNSKGAQVIVASDSAVAGSDAYGSIGRRNTAGSSFTGLPTPPPGPTAGTSPSVDSPAAVMSASGTPPTAFPAAAESSMTSLPSASTEVPTPPASASVPTTSTSTHDFPVVSAAGPALSALGVGLPGAPAPSAAPHAAPHAAPPPPGEHRTLWEPAEWLNLVLPLITGHWTTPERRHALEKRLADRFASRLNMKKPSIMGDFTIETFDLGVEPPLIDTIHAEKFDPVTETQEIRAMIYYPGVTRMVLSTKFGMPVKVKLNINSLCGEAHLFLPSSLDKYFCFYFSSPPQCEVSIETTIGTKEQVKNLPILRDFIRAKFDETIRNQVVGKFKKFFILPIGRRKWAMYSQQQIIDYAKEHGGWPPVQYNDAPAASTSTTTTSTTDASTSSPTAGTSGTGVPALSAAEAAAAKARAVEAASAGPSGSGAVSPRLAVPSVANNGSNTHRSTSGEKEEEPSIRSANFYTGEHKLKKPQFRYCQMAGPIINLYDNKTDMNKMGQLNVTGLRAELGGAPVERVGTPWYLRKGAEILQEFYSEDADECAEWVAAVNVASGVPDESHAELHRELQGQSAIVIQSVLRRWKARTTFELTKLRRELLQNLVEDERRFVFELDIIVNKYHAPILSARGTDGSILDELKSIDTIFGRIPEFQFAHRELLDALELRLRRWHTWQTVGDLFFDLFKNKGIMYKQYAETLPKILAHLKRCEESFPEFRDFLKRVHDSGFSTLTTLLPRPCYRTEKYSIILSQLQKHTPKFHDDVPLLSNALAQIKRLDLGSKATRGNSMTTPAGPSR